MDPLDGATPFSTRLPAVPPGRAARLWRVVVELSVAVEDAVARHAAATAEPGGVEAIGAGRGRGFVNGQLEKLVVEFDDAYTSFVEGMQVLPSESQLAALQAVDQQLAAMVRAQEAELWTERAVREDRRWSEAQRCARAVIERFDWPERRLALVGAGTEADGSASAVSHRGDDVPRRSP